VHARIIARAGAGGWRISLGRAAVSYAGRPRIVIGCSVPRRRHEMLLIRDIMYCKPGKVRPMVDKFIAMSKLGEKAGMPKMRVMTDLSAERYWTVVAEMEVASLTAFEQMFQASGQSEQDMKEFENIMKGYHDLVEYGRREIYKIEG
jgi:hypothetical protein